MLFILVCSRFSETSNDKNRMSSVESSETGQNQRQMQEK